MKLISIVTAVAAASALVAACGGGGDAGEPTAAGTLTALQAKTLAARTIHAVFMADDVAAQLQHHNFAALGTYPSTFGLLDARCAGGSGSGSMVLTDQDQSATLSQGDQAVYQLDACSPASGSRWTFTGAPTLQVTGGSNVHGTWLDGEPGVVELRLQADSLAFASGWYLNGTWSSVFTWGQPGAGLSNALAATQLQLGASTIQFVGVQFGGADDVQHLSGEVATSVEGLGEVRARLSLPAPLALDPQSPARYVPISGTVRVSASAVLLDVVYGPGGAVMLRVDAGNDGSIDFLVETTQQELDSLMETTPALSDEPQTECISMDVSGVQPQPCLQVNATTGRAANSAPPAASAAPCTDCGRFAQGVGKRLWPAARGGVR